MSRESHKSRERTLEAGKHLDALSIGDRVEVLDEGLAMLRKYGMVAPPNNIGKVVEFWPGGDVLVEFPLSGENHSQVALYPRNRVKKL